jgi:hypothetical protein
MAENEDRSNELLNKMPDLIQKSKIFFAADK